MEELKKELEKLSKAYVDTPENEEKILIPFIKRLLELPMKDRRKLLPLIRELQWIKGRFAGFSSETTCSAARAHFLSAVQFVCANKREMDMAYHVKFDMLCKLLPLYCPTWLMDFINDDKTWFNFNLNYEQLMQLMDMGYLKEIAPSRIAHVLPWITRIRNKEPKGNDTFNSELLLKRDITLKEHIWTIFEYESSIGYQDDCAKEAYKKGVTARDESISAALYRFSLDGHLDRERLLKATLATFHRSFKKDMAGWFAGFFETLQPTTGELLSLQEEMMQIFTSSYTKPVNVMLQQLKNIASEEGFRYQEFIERATILFFSSPKNSLFKACGGKLDKELLKEAKRMEFPDNVIARWTGKTEEEIKNLRYEYGITAAFKMVDTCAAEFASETPYYYSCFDGENEVEDNHERKKIMVLGSGPIRIGQGIEFDYCSVHSVWALSQEGYETIIVNNNPETVSTDFDIADKLYFEPLTPEDVENIVRLEKPDGAVVQFGGQTAINLTESLMKMGVKILGTSAKNVDAAEDRELFDDILEECCIPRAKGDTVFTTEEALKVANELGYPVLIRPSYVLGGQGMQIAVNDKDIVEFMAVINRYHQEHPILIDKYLMGKEIEVDAVCDGEDILIPGIMEHIERAGIHSGDSISVYPAQTISEKIQNVLVDYTRKLARSLHVIGLINIQFIVYQDEVYVIEVNPRSSRTVPYISKVTGIPIVDLASRVILGAKIRDLGYEPGLAPKAAYLAIKMPVFSFEKLRGAEISLGPEMKSTGECLGIAKTFNEALYKAFLGAGVDLPKHKKMILSVKDADKLEAVDIARRFKALGYEIFATRNTARVLNEHGVQVVAVNRINEESPTLMDLLLEHQIDLVIDTPTHGDKLKDGFLIRRTAIETGVNCLTSLDTADALLTSLENEEDKLSIVDIATISEGAK